MVRVLLIVVSLFTTPLIVQSQEVQGVNLTKIHQLISKENSSNHYDLLIKRFQLLDTTLTSKEIHFLYFGKYFDQNYKPYEINDNTSNMFKHLKEGEIDLALDFGLKSMAVNPTSLKVLFGISLCYHYLENEDIMNRYLDLYFKTMSVILETGSGSSPKSAWVIMEVSDEYEILKTFNKKLKKQKLIDGYIDCLKVTNIKGEISPIAKTKKVYFNLAIPLMKQPEQEND